MILPAALLAALAAAAPSRPVMSQAAAQTALLGLVCLELLCWLLVLWAWMRAARPGATAVAVSIGEGSARDLADAFSEPAGAGPWRARLRTERAGPSTVSFLPERAVSLLRSPCFDRCDVEIDQLDGMRCQMTFRMDFGTVRRRGLRVAVALMVLALAVLAALAAVLHRRALGAAGAAGRGQVLHVAHATYFIAAAWIYCVIFRRSRQATEKFAGWAAARAAVLALAVAARRSRRAGEASPGS